MRDELKIRDGESKNAFIHRVYSSKVENGLTNQMCKDIINKELGTDYAESSLRGIYKVYSEVYDEILETVKNTDELEELEFKRREFEKEKIRFPRSKKRI